MSSLEDHYPIDCPFCRIADAYPPGAHITDPNPEKVSPECYLILSTQHVLAFLDILPIAPGHILLTTRDHYRTLGDLYEAGRAPQGGQQQQQTWDVTQQKRRAQESARALGEALPLVSRALCEATGIEDWNVVQNNGERAAQVVPHVHFHLIPRYQEGRRETMARNKGQVDVGMLKSWRMFGRGTREELDEEEARALAGRLRGCVEREVGGGEVRVDGEEGKKGRGSKL